MVEKSVMVRAATGLHARPVSVLVNMVKDYEGTAELVKDEKSANLKSSIRIMALRVKTGDEVKVRVEGPEEESVCAKIVGLIAGLKD